MPSDARRKLPSVDVLLRSAPATRAAASVGRALLKQTLTEALRAARAEVQAGNEAPEAERILVQAIAMASSIAVGQTEVINATGVVLHTNLGRAPMPAEAARAAARAGAGTTDLEVDRATGARSRRGRRAEAMLRALTGAPAALVVNNCAAALLLALAALAKGKQVPVSRGELIEIGGEFRIPDILAASGARLVEVGTTNRTRAKDYRAAIGERTGAILKVHPSNYRVVGFTADVPARELAAIAAEHQVPFVFDIGSGLLDRRRGFPADEPSATEALAAGADLVTFSADKLLGGPQAGCVLGRHDLVERLRTHPIARAVRPDTMQIAAMESVLAMYLTGRHAEIPVHRMVHAPLDELSERAHRLAGTIGGDLEGAHVVRCESVVGGGSMPGTTMPSWGVSLKVPDADAFAARLRQGSPSVFGRVDGDQVVLDVRTVPDQQLPHLARAVLYAIEGDDLDED